MKHLNIMVIAEQNGGNIEKVSLELLGIAGELVRASGGKVSAVLFGTAAMAEVLTGYGADEVFVASGEWFRRYRTDYFAAAAFDIIRAQQPDAVLLGATSIGRDLAPRLSARLKTGLTADCTKLELSEEGGLLMTRPAFGGNLFATIVCPDHLPQMSTVRPGVMKANAFDSNRTGTVTVIDRFEMGSPFDFEILEQFPLEKQEQKIEDSKLLLSVGRGASSKETIACAKRVAKLLGGELGSSRALVDSGILPQQRQVGQTGKTVRPMIYIAAGISGAVQHVAGMDESEFIIAINKDPDAPIFQSAHYGIVGDASKILPLLEEALKDAKQKNVV